MKNYKITVLGASGSGKTVFLASLYKQLSIQREDFGFYLDINNSTQRRELVEKYRQIANPEQEWPASTDRRQNKSWTFTCCILDDKRQTHAVIDFTYLDYPGGSLTDLSPEENEENEEFEQAIRNADVLLCFLDGQKVLARMKHEKMGDDLVQRDLPNILPYIQKYQDKPVHFVLTKWDLFLTDEHGALQSGRDPLRSVRDFLLETDKDLKSIVRQRANKRPVRLIPISAVGKNFARWEGDRMKKVGRDPEPLYVEMPLVSVLFDVLDAHRKQLGQEASHVQNKPITSISMIMKNIVSFVTWPARVFVRMIPALSVPKPVSVPIPISDTIDIIIEMLQRKIEEWKNMELHALEQQKEQQIQAIRDEESALEATLNCFHYLFRKLRDEFPSSDFDQV